MITVDLCDKSRLESFRKSHPGKIVLAMGYFDGVHRGHQEVIKKAKSIAKDKGLSCALMSFDRHPAIIFKGINEKEATYLSPSNRKKQLLKKAGVDIFFLVPFTESFARQSPQEFIDQYVVGLGVDTLVAGEDYTYGPKDIADMNHLPSFAQDRFEIYSVPPVKEGKEKISSSLIRRAIEEGRMEEANEDLGYLYTLRGEVIHGAKRGRLIGYPTANIAVDEAYLLPKAGVYVASVIYKGHFYPSFLQLGYNKTFEVDRPDLSLEVHLFDFEGDLYGENLEVSFHHFLREEIRFPSAEALIEQLEQDKDKSLAYFKAKGKGDF
ncbi:riboflavin biosynthesis protein RibF [Atopobacter sp. AH10]|uniref:riboflavin biosynthesis protein RibF n=1 Tax=Atopobacter sp. AH10 TaxID=2315861 RepID=UPI000EF25D19|nr:riboflavin biosynthesis protein RibF [Atopobacter sp. AH10]RLK63408.1 riboflavin biosynthesis protein RibF [Atopobacter sp. AH10]